MGEGLGVKSEATFFVCLCVIVLLRSVIKEELLIQGSDS